MDSHVRLKASVATVEVCVPSKGVVIVGRYQLLSVAEVFVFTDDRVEAGTEVIIRLVLPSGVIRAEGLVAATTPPGNRPGFTVLFEEVLPVDRARIADAASPAA
jgi:hypothetical protein